MTRLLVKQAIAKDQASVAQTLESILSQNGIDTSHLSDWKCTPFGANQFLLVVLYSGIVLWTHRLGLAPVVRAVFAIKRTNKPLLGLKVVRKPFKLRRPRIVLEGLKVTRANRRTFKRKPKPLLGLLSIEVRRAVLKRKPKPLLGLKAVAHATQGHV